MKYTLLSLMIGSIIFTSGCNGRTKPATLGGLKYKETKEEKIEFKKMDHAEVRQEYEELLDLFEDQALKEQIERRIADVYMMEGVQDQLHNQPKTSFYVEAIKSYRDILEKYPNSPDNAEVFYQLAKAYDMEGDQAQALHMLTELTTRHPGYPNIAEAYFRMGDIYFNEQAYGKAERAYAAVTQSSNAKLALNARYMLGWSYYKQLKFDQALNTFAQVLNQVLAGHNSIDELSKTEKPFATDSLHSISLTLARSGGAEMIASVPLLAEQHYVWMVYENLGEYYLDKERFADSAYTYRLFVNKYRNSAEAPRLHKRLIDSYIEGGFPLQAIEEKEVFVNYYGIGSHYAGNKNGLREDLKAPLKLYLDELARHYYANAQTLQQNLADISAGKVSADDKKLPETRSLMVAAFDNAARFFNEYITTFAGDARLGEMTFLLGEARFSAFRYQEAIEAYETVAYRLTDEGHKNHGANAGYAAIISYQKLIDPLQEDSKEAKAWQQKAVASMLRFAEVFHADTRSPTVLTNAAEYLFSLDQYARALEVASGLINNNPTLDKTLKKTAYGIMAHSQFKLEDFPTAEQSYFAQRELVEPASDEYAVIGERLAATIYKRSELALASADKEAAIAQLLKIKRLTPSSKIRVNSQYDAATMMLELEQWEKALNEFRELTALYPEHELAVEFPRKSAFALEKLKRYSDAGDAYLALTRSDPDAELRREALFLAANMYENAKRYDDAIELFKRYAREYEDPFDARMEARYRIAVNYQHLGDEAKKLYWLRRIIAGDAEAGSARTERSQWLAAWANMEYGNYFASEFAKKKLRLPLDRSLPAKNAALKDAVGRYQQAADYGILEFVSQSSFKIAGLYQDFAEGLRAAPQPAGLTAADASAYRDILAEQAAPFVELALELHTANLELAWAGHYNQWIAQSFAKMRELNPVRFAKHEYEVSYGDEIR